MKVLLHRRARPAPVRSVGAFCDGDGPRDRRGQRWSLLPMMHDLGRDSGGSEDPATVEAQSLIADAGIFSPQAAADTTVYWAAGPTSLGTWWRRCGRCGGAVALLLTGCCHCHRRQVAVARPRRRRGGQRHTRDHDRHWLGARAVAGAPCPLPIPPHTNGSTRVRCLHHRCRISHGLTFELGASAVLMPIHGRDFMQRAPSSWRGCRLGVAVWSAQPALRRDRFGEQFWVSCAGTGGRKRLQLDAFWCSARTHADVYAGATLTRLLRTTC